MVMIMVCKLILLFLLEWALILNLEWTSLYIICSEANLLVVFISFNLLFKLVE